MGIRDIFTVDWLKKRISLSHDTLKKKNSYSYKTISKKLTKIQRLFDHLNTSMTKSSKDNMHKSNIYTSEKIGINKPIYYAFSITLGPDGKPHFKEFGNTSFKTGALGLGSLFGIYGKAPFISEKEPLAEISIKKDKIIAILEIPNLKKENIKVNLSKEQLEVLSNDIKNPYHQILKLPKETNIETVTTTYNNGFLEIEFKKFKS